jgi:predicted regulator of Ras-like GTPase activity (Roadblock/LC7/MglB family)
MSDAFVSTVERLSRIAGVRGALIVEREAAVPVISEVSEGVNGAAVAALAASLHRRMVQACETAGAGSLMTLQLEADHGHVVVAGAGEVVIVVITGKDAQIGLVRVEVLRAAGSLS